MAATSPEAELLVYDLKLSAKHIDLPVDQVPTKRNMQPASLFPFDDKVTTAKIWSVWFVSSSLRDHIDH